MNMGAAQIRNCVPDRGVTSGPSRVNPVHRHAGARAVSTRPAPTKQSAPGAPGQKAEVKRETV
jgi:hypothetical protein